MKRIRIFLASSITDLKFDRIEIGNFFRQLNDIYIESGVYFDLVMCEDYDNGVALDGKQAELDRLLCDSELVFFIFFNMVGEYTKHEFEVALENYKNSQKPKIVTYFKCVNDAEEAAEDVKDFMKMLDGELRHYYNIYREIDTLKLGIFMQIKLMRLDNVELTVEDGMLMHGKTKIAETKNIPMFECNEKLKELKEALAEADKNYRSTKIALLKNGTDDAYLAFSDAASEKEQAEKALRRLETDILNTAEKMYEMTADGNKLSEKQRQAYRHIEKGEWPLALAILDKKDILDELSHNEKLGDGIRERIAINVSELLQRIEVLKAAGLDKDSIEEILSIYGTISDITVKYALELKPLLEYASFLHNQNCDEKALSVVEKLSYLYADPDRTVKNEERAELLLQQAKIFVGLHKYDEALEALKRGKPLADELFAEEGSRVALLCADIRNISSNAYYYKGLRAESLEYCEDAKKYYEIAYAYDEKKNKGRLAMIYDNYAIAIEEFDRFDEALEYHFKAQRMYLELISEDEKYKISLARCYHNTAFSYKCRKDFDKSEEYYLRSIELREEIRRKNPSAVEPHLSETYYFLGQLYKNEKKNAEKATEALTASKNIRILLRKRSKVYDSKLNSIFHAFIYDDTDTFTDVQKARYREEYVNLLCSFPELTAIERRELCEESILYAYTHLYDADPEKAFVLLKQAIDIYLEEGGAWWYVNVDGALDALKSLAAGLGRLSEYIEYGAKLERKRADGDRS